MRPLVEKSASLCGGCSQCNPSHDLREHQPCVRYPPIIMMSMVVMILMVVMIFMVVVVFLIVVVIFMVVVVIYSTTSRLFPEQLH